VGRRGIVLLTIVISAALHVGVATGLVAVAKNREVRRRAIQVAVQGEKKKEKPKPPPPPKPIVHAAPKPAAPPPTAAPVHAAPVHSAPIATNLAMSNTGSAGGLDVGPGIGLHGRADAPAAAAVKTASAISEKRIQKVKDESGGADAPCTEEPTKPVAEVKSELSYALHPQAQADGLEGTFRARLTIDADGQVSDVEVQAGIEPAFDAALVAALKTWRFKPAMACGKPVAGGTFVVKRTFELGD
jgi:protein TonB